MTKKEQTLTEKFRQLEELTTFLEGDDVNIEQALEKFEEGLTLASECKKQLTEVENKVQKMKEDFKEVLE